MDLTEMSVSLHSAAVATDGSILAIAVEEEKAERKVEHAHLLVFTGQGWKHLRALDFSCVRVVWRSGRDPCWVVLGVNGQIVTCTRKEAIERTSIFPRAAPGKMGMMSSLRVISGRIYAVGMRRQIFSADETLSEWTSYTDTLASLPTIGDVEGFEGIGGIDESQIIAVGWNGEIVQGSRDVWRRISSPTNLILYGVCCNDAGDAWAAGQGGVLLHGRGDAWEIVDYGAKKEDFWDLVWYRGRLYASTLRSVFCFEDGRATRVDMEDATTYSCYHLSVAGDYLCSAGPYAISLFDGSEWLSVDLP
jgi:hypothetical protein